LRFEVVDADSDGTNEIVGWFETTLAELIKNTTEGGMSENKLTVP